MCLVIFCNSWHKIPKIFLILTPASLNEVMWSCSLSANWSILVILFCCQEVEFMMWWEFISIRTLMSSFLLSYYINYFSPLQSELLWTGFSFFFGLLWFWVCFVLFSMCYIPVLLPWRENHWHRKAIHPAAHWKLELFVPLRLLSHPPVSSQCSQCLWDKEIDLLLENIYIPNFGIASHLVYSCTAISKQHCELCFSKTLFLGNMECLE